MVDLRRPLAATNGNRLARVRFPEFLGNFIACEADFVRLFLLFEKVYKIRAPFKRIHNWLTPNILQHFVHGSYLE